MRSLDCLGVAHRSTGGHVLLMTSSNNFALHNQDLKNEVLRKRELRKREPQEVKQALGGKIIKFGVDKYNSL